MSSIDAGPWESFPSEGGEALAFSGGRLAVAGRARLVVWEGRQRIAAVDAPAPAPGTPRFAGSRVYWGPGFLDLASGRYELLEAAVPEPVPDGGEFPHHYAWSPRGERLLACFSSGAYLHDGASGARVTLDTGPGPAPQSGWLGAHAAVLTKDNPRVFDVSGRPVAEIALHGAVVATLAVDDEERRLLAVGINRTAVWIDTATWAVVDRWPGPWRCGAVSPDGGLVALLGDGNLHLARVANDRFVPAGQAGADPRTVAIALDRGEVVTVGGGEVRRALLDGTP